MYNNLKRKKLSENEERRGEGGLRFPAYGLLTLSYSLQTNIPDLRRIRSVWSYSNLHCKTARQSRVATWPLSYQL